METITIVESETNDKEEMRVAIEKVKTVQEWQGTLRDINQEISNIEHEENMLNQRKIELNEIKAKIEPVIDAKVAEKLLLEKPIIKN